MNYDILSVPMSPYLPPEYKGLYRSNPLPKNDHDPILPLWQRYVQARENRGVTDQLSPDQLRRLASLASTPEEKFEVVQFDTKPCNASLFYGVDIVGSGGYSAISDVLFPPQIIGVSSALCQQFRPVLNEYALFSCAADAQQFLCALEPIRSCFETENWRPVFVYRAS